MCKRFIQGRGAAEDRESARARARERERERESGHTTNAQSCVDTHPCLSPNPSHRPIGQNQGVQFPLAKAHANLEAAKLMVYRAAELYDQGLPCGPEANMAKMLAADASWEAANACFQTFGGFAFAREYDVERKFRETRLYQIAPISTNLILSHISEKVLGLPRSF